MPFMNKNLVNAHRKRTRLTNKFLKNRTESNRVYYSKQRNFCVCILRKPTKDYYGRMHNASFSGMHLLSCSESNNEIL